MAAPLPAGLKKQQGTSLTKSLGAILDGGSRPAGLGAGMGPSKALQATFGQ